MTQHLTDVLRELKGQRFKESLKTGKQMSELVFTDKGKMLSAYKMQKALNDCLEMAEIEHIRIHDLRHSYATIRLLKGHNIGDVSYQLGHASIKITYDCYTHWIPGHSKSEIDELDEVGGGNLKAVKKESAGR